MAKIKFSAIVSDARGKIGGNVFSRNKAGAYIRTFVKPINPATSKQQTIRNRVQNLVVQWRGLTAALRLAWNNAAQSFPQTNKLGETYFLSGQQLFTKFNSNLLALAQSIATAAPLNSSGDGTAISSLDGASGALTITTDQATLPTGTLIGVRATDGISAGRSNAFRSQFRQLGTVHTITTNEIDVASEFESVFGALTGKVGQKVFIELISYDSTTGQVISVSKSSVVIS